MNKYIKIISIIILFFSSLQISMASTMMLEKADVVRVDKKYSDLIIKRQNGLNYLVQHNKSCRSMDIDWPVDLLLINNEVKRIKVKANESCKVYQIFQYSDDITINNIIRTGNRLDPYHQAEITWKNSKYLIDFKPRTCKNIKNFIGERAYINMDNENSLLNSKLILPSHRGYCNITNVKKLEDEKSNSLESIKNIQFSKESNQIYFYWPKNKNESDHSLFLLSYSRKKINPENFKYREMPNLIRTRKHNYTVKNLKNGEKYHFYFSIFDYDNNLMSKWTQLTASPISLGGFKNNPDSEEFEISVSENNDAFILNWPSKKGILRYYTKFYVDGKRQSSKLFKKGESEYRIEKKDDYLGKKLKFTVRILSKKIYGLPMYDGIVWNYKK